MSTAYNLQKYWNRSFKRDFFDDIPTDILSIKEY